LKTYFPDTTVLIAAARQDHRQHTPAQAWLSQAAFDAASGAACIALPMLVVSGFVRIVTHAKIMSPPNTPAEALTYIDALLAALNIEVSEHRTWQPFKSLVEKQSLSGNDVPDAWLASYAIATGAVVVTFDKGFKKMLPKQHAHEGRRLSITCSVTSLKIMCSLQMVDEPVRGLKSSAASQAGKASHHALKPPCNHVRDNASACSAWLHHRLLTAPSATVESAGD
jgi:toxin-antitoxin system PIN domain toxin